MDIDIWDMKAGTYLHEHKVKYIFNSVGCKYFKLRYTDNTEKKFNSNDYLLEFIFSDNWKKEAVKGVN